MWDAAGVCRTCEQLGCPGKCRAGAGCKACPRGSVLLQTVPPAGFGRRDWHGYCTGLKPAPFVPVPKLPAICLRKQQDLRCAPGKAAHGVGCTACPPGMERQRLPPQFIAGSVYLQLQPEGFGCF